MKHHRSMLLALMSVTVPACTDAPTSPASNRPDFGVAAVGHLVVGSGHVQTAAGLREFTFHAVERPDGSVGGSYKVVLPNGLFIESDVTCVTVDGHTGFVGGVIRASNAGAVVIGSTSMFHATDNGEGGDGAPDVVGLLAFNRGEGADLGFCQNRSIEFQELTVTDGNVEVR